jgi:hypothetical protein
MRRSNSGLRSGSRAGKAVTRSGTPAPAATGWPGCHQQGRRGEPAMLLNPFCPFSAAQILALRATVLLLLALPIKDKVRVAAFSVLGLAMLILQTLPFLAAGGSLEMVAGAAGFCVMQRRKNASA